MRGFAEKWISDKSPMAMDCLEKNTKIANKCRIEWNGEARFEVIDGEYGHTIDLERQKCTCRSWEIKGIPCSHAICCIFYKKLNPKDFICKYYTKDYYPKSYNVTMQ